LDSEPSILHRGLSGNLRLARSIPAIRGGRERFLKRANGATADLLTEASVTRPTSGAAPWWSRTLRSVWLIRRRRERGRDACGSLRNEPYTSRPLLP